MIKRYQHKIIFKQHKTGRINSLVLPNATYSPWEQNEDFLKIFKIARQSTLVDKYRLYDLFILSQQLATVAGDFLEIGVWRGGSGALLASTAKSLNKKMYLADTFSGVVNASSKDTSYIGGEHADTSIKKVRELLAENTLDNVELLHGIFPEETSHFVENSIFSLVHIDVDVYESGRATWEWIQPRLSIGGLVIFDDFGFISCSGITTLVEELMTDPKYIFIHNLNGHAIFVLISRVYFLTGTRLYFIENILSITHK